MKFDGSDQHKKISSMGGKMAHKNGTAHEFTTDEAKKAGSLGGKMISQNIEHMKRIGKMGGLKKKKINDEIKFKDQLTLPDVD